MESFANPLSQIQPRNAGIRESSVRIQPMYCLPGSLQCVHTASKVNSRGIAFTDKMNEVSCASWHPYFHEFPLGSLK